MNDVKYIGLDVHQVTISAVVLDSAGKVVMESILETKAAAVLQFIHGLCGRLHVTFEEGTCAAWLHDLLKPHVNRVLVCDPRKNALLKSGNKNDRIDARKLADLLRGGLLSSVYHEESGLRALKELARSYLAVTQDLTRVMNRLKALYRSWAIPCAGERVYAPRHRGEWLEKISEPGVRRRAEFYYQQLDAFRALHHQVRRWTELHNLISAVGTAWPATRPTHSFLKFCAYPLNVLPSGFRFLDRDNPADPLIACEWRNILPFCPGCRIRNENFS